MSNFLQLIASHWDTIIRSLVVIVGIVILIVGIVILFVKTVNKFSIRAVCFTALFTAIISVLSTTLEIPTPWGVPFTLQTFAIALCGYVLGAKYSSVATMIYVLLGAVGAPVYAGMSSGPAVLFGATGGYIVGFVFMAFFCGLAVEFSKKKVSGILLTIGSSLLGLAFCHGFGIMQLKVFSAMTWQNAILKGTLLYLPKDIISIILAYLLAMVLRKALQAAKLLDWDRQSFATFSKP